MAQTTETSRSTGPALAEVTGVAESAVADGRLVGVTVRVLHRGELVHRSAHGWADREARRPFVPEQRVRLASVTKPIVTAAVLRLVEEGTLSLDEPVRPLLPAFAPAGGEGITLRHLLTHTAGLSYPFNEPADGPYHRAGVSSGFDGLSIPMAEELARISAAGLVSEPGSAFLYSVGLDVAGALVEAVTGRPLPDVVDELVARPLGLESLTFLVDDLSALAVPYADGDPPVRMGEDHEVPFLPDAAPARRAAARIGDARAFPSAGAGMAGDADDVARLLEAVRTGGGGVVGPDTAAAMMTNQVGDLRTDPTGASGFGFGGSVLLDPAATGTPQPAGTWTWGGVWGHTWWVDPVNELTVVSLSNTAIEGMMGSYVTELVGAVYDALARVRPR